MPLGEFLAVRTRSCDSVSGIGFGSKILTAAILGAVFKYDNLNVLWSSGVCKNKSAFGYSFRIMSIMDGPVSSNLLAPPTKQTAILEFCNSSLMFLHLWGSACSGGVGGRGRGEEEGWVGGLECWNAAAMMKDRRGAKVEKGMSGRVEAEKKRMRERGARMRKRRRQSRSVRDVRKAMGGIEENQWRKRGCKFLGVGKCGFPFERKWVRSGITHWNNMNMSPTFLAWSKRTIIVSYLWVNSFLSPFIISIYILIPHYYSILIWNSGSSMLPPTYLFLYITNNLIFLCSVCFKTIYIYKFG